MIFSFSRAALTSSATAVARLSHPQAHMTRFAFFACVTRNTIVDLWILGFPFFCNGSFALRIVLAEHFCWIGCAESEDVCDDHKTEIHTKCSFFTTCNCWVVPFFCCSGRIEHDVVNGSCAFFEFSFQCVTIFSTG